MDYSSDSTARRINWRRVSERTIFGLALLTLGVEIWSTIAFRITEIPYGADLRIYLDATSRFLSGGSFYQPEQLAGPYLTTVGNVLYPPPSVLLFAPFLVTPIIVWWVIPIAIVTAVVWKYRPTTLGLAAILVALACPYSLPLLTMGNPVIWVSAAVACATIYGWPAVFALIKPSLAPFALAGLWARSWWVALVGLAVASLPFAPMWDDYFLVLTNLRRDLPMLYSLGDVPLVLIPLIAWYARTRDIPLVPRAPVSIGPMSTRVPPASLQPTFMRVAPASTDDGRSVPPEGAEAQ